MNDPALAATVAKLSSALPHVLSWIDDLLERSGGKAKSVASTPLAPYLKQHYPEEFLAKARVVETQPLPFPPLTSMGLQELSAFENLPAIGITYKDTFFVTPQAAGSIRLYFHELVHVVQWNHLGPERFLLAYGVGLLAQGYENSPLERMARKYEQSYVNDKKNPDLIGAIQADTDAVWQQVAPLVGSG